MNGSPAGRGHGLRDKSGRKSVSGRFSQQPDPHGAVYDSEAVYESNAVYGRDAAYPPDTRVGNRSRNKSHKKQQPNESDSDEEVYAAEPTGGTRQKHHDTAVHHGSGLPRRSRRNKHHSSDSNVATTRKSLTDPNSPKLVLSSSANAISSTTQKQRQGGLFAKIFDSSVRIKELIKDKAALVTESISQIMDNTPKASSWQGGMKPIVEKRRAIAPAPQTLTHHKSITSEDYSTVIKPREVGAEPAPYEAEDSTRDSIAAPPPSLPVKLYQLDEPDFRDRTSGPGSQNASNDVTRLSFSAQGSLKHSLSPVRFAIEAPPSRPPPPPLSSGKPAEEDAYDYTYYEKSDYNSVNPVTKTSKGKKRTARRRRKRIAKICEHLAACSCAGNKAASAEVMPIDRLTNLEDSIFSPDLIEDLTTVARLFEAVSLMGVSGLISQFHSLSGEPYVGTFNVGSMPAHTYKNRYADVLCYDETRVVLSPINDDPTTDYINASYVNGYKQKFGYIACQGPLSKTNNDFWRMVWQEDCRVIVMTTRVVEKGKHKCTQYWPDQLMDTMDSEHFTLTCLEIDSHDIYICCQLYVQNKETGERREVYHLLFLSWPDYGVPASGTDFLDYLFTARDCQERAVLSMGPSWRGHPRGPPIVVHCSAGVGRSGTFICADICIHMIDDIFKVNIVEVVKRIRRQRAYAIQTGEQYLFCYAVILEYAQKRGLIAASADLTMLLA